MKMKLAKNLGMAALVLFAACKNDSQNKDDAMDKNIILAEWTGPYQGVPAFNKMKVEMLKPAILKQPRVWRISVLSAINAAGSPARRPVSVTGKSTPDCALTTSITSRTVKPRP